jgi:hypothetical protein
MLSAAEKYMLRSKTSHLRVKSTVIDLSPCVKQMYSVRQDSSRNSVIQDIGAPGPGFFALFPQLVDQPSAEGNHECLK